MSENTSGKRLSPAEWEQIVVLWESGSVTLGDLSERFGISRTALSQGLSRRNAVKGARSGEFAKTTERALKTENERLIEDIRGFRKKFHVYGDFIMQAAMKELKEVITVPRDQRSRQENARVFTWLKNAAEIYSLCRDQKFHLYDLYNQDNADTDVPEIAIAEYSPEEITKIQQQQHLPVIDEDDELMVEARKALEGTENNGVG